jgi:hypothetical protein
MRADGSRIEQLSRSFSLNWISSLSPDGQWIIFRSDSASRGFDLYRMRLDGSGFQRLTIGDDIRTDIDWSPDGQWIIYNSRSELHPRNKMRLDGSQKQPYSAFECSYGGIEIHDDWISYHRNNGTHSQIIMAPSDCSEHHVLIADYRYEALMTLAPVFDVSTWHPARLALLSLLAITIPHFARRRRILRS